jgi:choline dehydrogenase
MYESKRPDGSTFALLSGRVLGGGSTVNNLAFVRPMRIDFDAWARFGGDGWSYDAMLPTMRDIEADPEFADSSIHGTAGPLAIHRPFRLDGQMEPTVEALMEAAHQLGLPDCPDMNVPEPLGICASPYNWLNGRRQSIVDAYITPARSRSNLEILPEATVVRIVFDGRRACGVEVATEGRVEIVEAERIVLAAGTYHSPQILLLSGIGSPVAIEPHGLRVNHRLDGVGKNHHDHAVVYVTYEGTVELQEDYVIPKVRLIAKSDERLDRPDLHVFLRPSIRVPGLPPLLPVSIHLLEHRSAGRVSLASADPGDLPVVDAGLLRDEEDVRAIVDGIAFTDRLTNRPALARFYGEMVTPDSPDSWSEHAVTAYDSYHHGVGTCRMGPLGDVEAVVDGRLRVHGLEALWVADASVLPTVPHANTNVAAVLVGEYAARELATD